MTDIFQFTRIVHEVIKPDIAVVTQFLQGRRVAVVVRTEPAHELVMSIHHGPKKSSLAEIWRAVLAAGFLQLLLPTGVRAVRPGVAQFGQFLQRPCDRPIFVERVQTIPAKEGAVSRSLRAAPWPGLLGLQHSPLEAPTLQVRITRSDFFFAESGECQKSRSQIQL